MRSISKSALLALMTALALSAVVVSSADAAAPVFKYTGTGPQAKAFSGKVSPGFVFEMSGENGAWKCKSTAISGEIDGSSGSHKVKNVFYTFSGCETVFGYITTKGQARGVIKSTELEGELGVVSGGESHEATIGLILKPKSKTPFFEAVCGGELVVDLRGNPIGTITPINHKTKTGFTLTHTQSNGKDTVTKFEGALENPLELQFGVESYGVGLEDETALAPLEGEMEIVH